MISVAALRLSFHRRSLRCGEGSGDNFLLTKQFIHFCETKRRHYWGGVLRFHYWGGVAETPMEPPRGRGFPLLPHPESLAMRVDGSEQEKHGRRKRKSSQNLGLTRIQPCTEVWCGVDDRPWVVDRPHGAPFHKKKTRPKDPSLLILYRGEGWLFWGLFFILNWVLRGLLVDGFFAKPFFADPLQRKSKRRAGPSFMSGEVIRYSFVNSFFFPCSFFLLS